VLEDERLSDGAKIMYGKIARLSAADGRCWASNSFLDGTKSGRNASRAIAELRDTGYILIENDKSRFRKIRICGIESKINLAQYGDVENFKAADLAKFGEVENPDLAKNGEVEKSESPDLAKNGEVENPDLANSGDVDPPESPYIANSGEVEGKKSGNLAKFGDRTSSSSRYINSTTTTSGPPENENLPTVEKVVAVAQISPGELKKELSQIDNSLFFDAGFYAKASAFMAERGLGIKYLSWLKEQCELKENLRSLKAYYYSVFFQENMAEQFTEQNKASLSPPAKPPSRIRSCPVCGTEIDYETDVCPSCSLPTPNFARPEDILLYRSLHEFPPEKRDEYFFRKDNVFAECGYNFEKLRSRLDALKQEFGL